MTNPFKLASSAKVLRALVIQCAVVTILFSPAAYAQDSDEPEGGPVVLVGQVSMSSDKRERNVIGVTRAIQAAVLVPDSDGHIEQFFVSSGEYVEKGQQLFKLETTSEELSVSSARLKRATAQRELNRLKILDEKGTITAVQMETAVDTLQATELELKAAELALSDRYVIAPFSGYIGLIDISVGAYVTTSTELTQLIDRSSLLVDFALPETAVGDIEVGDLVAVSAIDSDEQLSVPVIAMGSHVDETSRTFALRAEIKDPPKGMLPGMSYRIQIDIETGTYPVVPEVAILWGSRGAYVWRVDDQEAHRIPITIVRRRNGKVLVVANLTEGDWVVSEGVQKVREGDLISLPEGHELTEKYGQSKAAN